MVELLRRREMVLAASAPVGEWDYEWDASKGVLTSNGFTRVDVGTGGYTPTIVDDYLQFRGSSSNYRYFNYERTCTTGVMEAEIWAATNGVLLLALGNGTNSIGVGLRASSSYKGIYLGTGTTTKIVTASAETKYKVRLVLKGSTADVYINNVLRSEDVDISELTVPDIRITGRGAGSGNIYTRLYSLKLKFNRI